MTEPENILLQYMRKFDSKLDRFGEELCDVKGRIASIETKMAQMHADYISQLHRTDLVREDNDLIKRRLELSDPRH